MSRRVSTSAGVGAYSCPPKLTPSGRTGRSRRRPCPEASERRSRLTMLVMRCSLPDEGNGMGQFHWRPETYLEQIRAEVPRYDELQDQAVGAIPFPPERVLELGMGTGVTTERLLEAYPGAWVAGLDSSPEM